MLVIKKILDFMIYCFGRLYCLIYNYKYWLIYRKYIWRNQEVDHLELLFVHFPKTAGRSVVFGLNPSVIGHFPISLHTSLNSVDKLVISFRNPEKRLQSIYKYSHMKENTKLTSPLWIVSRFSNINSFVESALFDCFIKYHYFFRPQVYFLEGIDELNVKEFHVLRFDNIGEDFEKVFNRELPRTNVSPKDSTLQLKSELTIQVKNKIKYVYMEDYLYIQENDLGALVK